MKKCKSCQTEIDSKAKKCSHCQTDQRNWFLRHPLWTVIIILVVIGIMSSSSSGSKKSPLPSNTNERIDTTSQKVVENTPVPTGDPNPHFTDGIYEVGKDIKSGTYRTRVGSSGCYYSRLSGFGGSLEEIISNENTDYPAVITIAATDKGFKSSRCGVWTQDLSQVTLSKTSFDDGIYIIGTDIEPGKYKNKGQDGCYYSRLRGFSGSLGDIISNENTNDPAIVSIATTDKGFKSSRCGTWTKI